MGGLTDNTSGLTNNSAELMSRIETKWPNGDEVVGPFRGDHEFLSNFASWEVDYAGQRWPTAEHAYQACKTQDPNLWNRILQAQSPGKAKKLGYRADLPDWWEEQKDSYMFEIVSAKFAQHFELQERLLETGRRPIVELNTRNDTYWGAEMESGVGRNKLGRILMGIRDTFRRMKPGS